MFKGKQSKKQNSFQISPPSVGNQRQSMEKLTRDTAKRTRYIVFLLFGVSLIIYLTWQLYQIITPPLLLVEYPPEGSIVTSQKIVITGYIDPDSQLTINQELVLPDTDGKFEKVVNLEVGINAFIFKATKRYGPNNDLTRYVEYKPQAEVKGVYIDFKD